jgi:hypothetical protein
MAIDMAKQPPSRTLLEVALAAQEVAMATASTLDIASADVHAAVSSGSRNKAIATVNIALSLTRTALADLRKLEAIANTAIASDDPNAATILQIFENTTIIVCASVDNATAASNSSNKLVAGSSAGCCVFIALAIFAVYLCL